MNRYGYIDNLRGIAALLVVLIHTSESFAASAGSGLWLHEAAAFWQSGTTGVMLFFLISGFVIPSSFRSDGSRLAELKKFAIRRFFRLFPAYWLSIPASLVTIYWVWNVWVDPVRIAANLTMIQGFLGFEDIEGLYWTLQNEVVFYVICAASFALSLLKRGWFLTTMALLLGALLFISHGQRVEGWFGPIMLDHPQHELVGSLAFMFLGAVLRKWHDGELAVPLRVIATLMVLAWIGLPLLRWWFASADGLVEPGPDLRYTLALVLFVVVGLWMRFTTPLTAWLGQISYSIYLFHPVVFYGMIRLISSPHFSVLKGHDLLTYVLVASGVTLLLAVLVYRYVESPAIELGRRLSRSPAALSPRGESQLQT